ncbi:hypothetical protein PWP89_08085 [Stenotrophomonas rhizophila]|uniref:LPO_1073/Vpar_1526 family protein n=1 Tax=Stenotrophomonas rhizophila TaxID=216778 RepID=UPI001C4EE110|nr:LPO_1073/Vpar_1526 family protein [Stenotrophomonas rhizophila]
MSAAREIRSKISRFLAPLLAYRPVETSGSGRSRIAESSSADQRQSASDGGTALQAGRDISIIHGMNYADTKQVALDVFRSNFYELAGLAKQEATARAEEVTEAFLKKLLAENPGGFQYANDPGFQHALYTVQKEHAKTGDPDLGDLLVDLLVDRTKYPQRDFVQIVLDESLSTAPKLTEAQLADISVIFLLRFTRNGGLGNYDTFGRHLDQHVQPFVSKLTKSQASFQHLEFSGCGSIAVTEILLEEVFRRTYAGLFVKGFDPQEVVSRGVTLGLDERIFVPSLNDPTKIQVRALTTEQLEATLEQLNIGLEDRARIRGLFEYNAMTPDEIRARCVELRPYMAEVFDFWSNSAAKNFTLTSVGIALAHANIKRLAGEFADLAIWIN